MVQIRDFGNKAGASDTREYRLKATHLFNLIEFVEGPISALAVLTASEAAQ